MYGIIHKKIFDSTIIAEGFEIAYVFMSMITLADDEDICDMSLSALALRINMPLAKVEHAISRLILTDEDSKSQSFNGKRIVPLKDIDEIESNRGWFMVNRESYIDEAKKENRKKTNARHYMKSKSENGEIKTKNILKPTDSEIIKTHIDIDIDIDKNIDVEALKEFIEHRKQIKSPMSALAVKKLTNKLAKLSLDEQRETLDTSIQNGWKGIFPKEDKQPSEIVYQ